MTAQNCLQQRGMYILIPNEMQREVEELKLLVFLGLIQQQIAGHQ